MTGDGGVLASDDGGPAAWLSSSAGVEANRCLWWGEVGWSGSPCVVQMKGTGGLGVNDFRSVLLVVGASGDGRSAWVGFGQ